MMRICTGEEKFNVEKKFSGYVAAFHFSRLVVHSECDFFFISITFSLSSCSLHAIVIIITIIFHSHARNFVLFHCVKCLKNWRCESTSKRDVSILMFILTSWNRAKMFILKFIILSFHVVIS